MRDSKNITEQKIQQIKKERERQEKSEKRMSGKMVLIFFVIVLCLIGLSIRIVYINKNNGEKYTKKVLQQQSTNDISLPYRRGDILDRNGTILATSEKTYNIVLESKVLRESEELSEGCIEATLTALVKYFDLGMSLEELREKYEEMQAKNNNYYVLKEKMTKSEIEEFQALMEAKDSKIEGVSFEECYKRFYPYNTLACNVIGHLVEGNEGVYGIEEQYSDILNGIDGRSYNILNDAMETEKVVHEPTHGYSVVSTIDITLQKIVEEAIDGFMEKYANAYRQGDGAKTAACILMDPRNGEILAMASNRKYNLNEPNDTILNGIFTAEELAVIEAEIKAAEDYEKAVWNDENSTDKEKEAASEAKANARAKKYDPLNALWRNFCVSDTYEPGSTVKPMTIAAALEAGDISESECYYCDGGHVAVQGQRAIKCAKRSGHGMITLEGALMFSCNDALMQIASKMGYENFVKYQRLFNFGLRTGIDLPGESRTDRVVYYTQEDAPAERYVIGPAELATCSFGQGFNVSMVQMVSAFSSCINGGYYYQPHVAKRILDSNGATVEEFEPKLLRTTISAETSEKVKQYLYNTMYGEKDANGNTATGKKARIAGYAMGGKTGTAQKIPRGNGNYLVSFIGYAPYDEPQVVCYVIVDEPNSDYQASSSFAMEIWKEIMQKTLPYLNIFETEDPPKDMVDEYNATHAEKAEDTGEEEDSEETQAGSAGPVVDPQTGQTVTPPDVSNDSSVDPETGFLTDLTQDDAYPSDLITDDQTDDEDQE